jgi:hypothetical protein
MMSLDRWADGGAGSRFGGAVATAFFLLPAVSALLFLFVSFAPSVNNVLLSLQRLRGDAGGGGLGSGFDGGRPFFLFFSVFFFSSVCLCFRFFLLLLTGLLSTGRAMAAGGDAGGGGEESDDASRWL